MGWELVAWQIGQLLLLGGIVFLIVRLLIINNFPRKSAAPANAWLGVPAYPVVVFWSEADGRFIAEVPDLPGCTAEGVTPAAALSNAATAVKQWLATAQELQRPVPPPSPRLRPA